MSEIVFRRAQISDLPSIVALLVDDDLGRSREDASTPINRKYVDAFEALQRDPNQLIVVVVDSDAVVGCAQISFIPGLSRMGMWRGQVESVRIAASHRGEGLGHRLFEWVIAECRSRGCGLLQLTSDKARADARRFYESLGFRASHEGMKLNL
jgi:ribosomal protein S18 acetylase RimI-like enzyme